MYTQEIIEETEPVVKLSRDLKKAAATLTATEARFLVDSYYTMQSNRIRAGNQIFSMSKTAEPHEVLTWFSDQAEGLENQIRGALGVYAKASTVGKWSLSQCGIGPVISAGLLAHIDITKAPTVGHITRFAGLDPTIKWLGNEGAKKLLGEALEMEETAPDETSKKYELSETELAELGNVLTEERSQLTTWQLVAVARLSGRKFGNLLRLGQDENGKITRASMLRLLAKRPWNASLKVLCYKIGESFVKTQNRKNDFYGHVYAGWKLQYQERNEAGLYSERSAAELQAKNYSKSTDAYKAYSSGKLPPAHIHAMARRKAIHLFLAHWHSVAYRAHYGKDAPAPYAIEFLGHAHYVECPNWPFGK